MGPKSRNILAPLTEADLSAKNAPWLTVKEITLAGVQVTAMRVSYIGELGWELHLSSNHLVQVYNAIIVSQLTYGLASIQLTNGLLKRLDAFQMRGLRYILKIEHANARELPHCPAPVSVVIFFVPSSLLKKA